MDVNTLPTMERRKPVARWAISLSEPLLSTSERVLIDREMIRFVQQNPNWSAAFFAGLLHDTVATLPAPDPWRNLSGTILDPRTGRRLVVESTGVAVPEATGARSAAGPFHGTWRDETDLMSAPVGDPATDLASAAVRAELDPTAAALIAFAGHGWRITRGAIEEVQQHAWRDTEMSATATATNAHVIAFETVVAALRAVTHRRRLYTGADDQFTVMSAFAWMVKADSAVTDTDWDATEGTEILESARIEDDAYEALRLPSAG